MKLFYNVSLSNRIPWIEGIRFVAIMLVVVPHFIACFCPQKFALWDEYSFILKGISGKLGVSMFCVLVGYFASRPSPCVKLHEYILRRYLEFSLNIFVVVMVFLLVKGITEGSIGVVSILKGIRDVVFLGSSIVPTFWCVRDIFYGSVLCFVLGNFCKFEKKTTNILFLICIAVFEYFTLNVWVSVCVLGSVCRSSECFMIKKELKIICILIAAVLIPVLYRRSESNLTYFMQGISCCLFIFVVKNLSMLQYILGNRVFAFLGNISFYMFLTHTPVNIMLYSKLFVNNHNVWLMFVLSIGITLLLSYLLFELNNRVIKKFIKKIQID